VKVVYVSYDGALDPLGATQVVPYLIGLAARGVGMTLVSFEKREAWLRASAAAAMRDRLDSSGVRWKPLGYHKWPRTVATSYDVYAGSRVVASEALRSGASLVHCRGDVAMAIARWAALKSRARLLYDVRGLFSDERVEVGSWTRGSLVDRAVRRMEAANLRAAAGIVVLTTTALEVLATRCPSLRPHRVIPTCANLSVFRPRAAGEAPEYGLVYSGSLGSWYMTREMVTFARVARRAVPGRALFLTPHVAEAREAGASPDWAEVRTVEPSDVPAWLRRATALLFFIRPTPAKRASCPTKLAEGLACGLPVVCNRGIGDLDGVVEKENVGILVDSLSERGYEKAIGRLACLLQDPELPARCRRLAESRYDLEAGIDTYHQLYREICSGA
jgi:glycosyltransferase involved in cell wall biosynthesis